MYIFQFLQYPSRPICSLTPGNKNLNAASQFQVVLILLTMMMVKEIHVLIHFPWNRWLPNDILFSHCGRSFVCIAHPHKYSSLTKRDTCSSFNYETRYWKKEYFCMIDER